MVYRLSHMIENERTLSSSFYEVSNNQFQNQIKTTKKLQTNLADELIQNYSI